MFRLKLHSLNAVVCTLGLICINYVSKAQKGSDTTVVKPKSTVVAKQSAEPEINIGYLKVKRSAFTGAVSIVQENRLMEMTAVSMDGLLQGQVAGLQVTNISGAPGSGALTTIRGASTINGGAMPLYIVDGIPVKTYRFVNPLTANVDNNPLADINPNDIASVTVLKDGHATAIYGMRGSNGVVIINTHGGTAGKTYLDFSAYTGIMRAPEPISVLEAGDYRTFILEKERSRGLNQQAIENGIGRYLLVSTPQNQLERYNNNTNWQDEILKQGYFNNYHLKLRGGDAIARYSLNIGYTNQTGVISSSNYERFTTRFNLDYKVNRKLTILNTISYARTDKNLQDEGNVPNTNPLFLATLKSPMLAVYSQDLAGTDLSKLDSADYILRSNPYAVANKMKNVNNTNRILGAITGQYVFSRTLTLSSSISADYLRLNETRFRPEEGFAPEEEVLRSSSESNSSEIMLMNENILNYNKTLKNHSFNALVGNAFQSTDQRNEFAVAINSPSDEFTSISATDPQLIDSISSYAPNWKLMSFFTAVNYSYKGKLFIGANFRADGSSRFAKGKQWGYFPSIAAAWKLSRGNKLINDLKLRASYGLSGNQEVGYYGSYNALVPAIYGNQPGVRLGMVGNPNFTWEKTRQFNAGLDFSIFKRLSVNADFYIKHTKDLLNYINLPGTSGFTTFVVNDGSIRNTGVELSVSGKLLTGVFGWQTNLTAAYNKNKVLSYPQSQEPITNYGGYQTNSGMGSSIGAFYGYNAIGVYSRTSDVTLKNGADNAFPFKGGDIIFEDIDKNGVIDEADRKVIGNGNPAVSGGFSNVFSYKKFDLTVLMDFALGREVYNAQRASLESMSNYDNQSTSINSRWSAEGDVTDMPRFLHGDAVGNTRFSSRWVEDGSYLRFKMITLGYNLPVKENRKVLKSARISISAQNLYTFSKYKGYGAEMGSIANQVTYSVDYGNVPQLQSFVVGLQLGL